MRHSSSMRKGHLSLPHTGRATGARAAALQPFARHTTDDIGRNATPGCPRGTRAIGTGSGSTAACTPPKACTQTNAGDPCGTRLQLQAMNRRACSAVCAPGQTLAQANTCMRPGTLCRVSSPAVGSGLRVPSRREGRRIIRLRNFPPPVLHFRDAPVRHLVVHRILGKFLEEKACE